MDKDFLLEFKEDPDMRDKEVLWEMASIRGKYVVTDDINFSFLLSIFTIRILHLFYE